MARIESIQTLHQRGWSQRRIARELGIDRETVARHLQCAAAEAKPANALAGSAVGGDTSKPANAPPGSADESGASKPANAPPGSADESGASKPAKALAGSEGPHRAVAAPTGAVAAAIAAVPVARPAPGRGRPSACEPWRAAIVAMLQEGLSAQRIYQDLVGEHGYAGSYYSVRRFVGQLEPALTLPVRRLECAPGEEVQVDFGTGAWIRLPDGRRRRSHVLRMVLSHSRKGYSEAVARQTAEAFLGALENGLVAFGGAPRTIVLDNLKAGVLRADWFDPELNPKFASFCQHYGMVALPTRPRRPEHKGKVERGVGYVQDNGLKGREFTSLEEQNHYLRTWEEQVADRRIHGTTKRQVGQHFVEAERPALRPLPLVRFPYFHEERRKVNRDGHIEVARAYYSVPPEYLGQRVWVRWDSRLVRIFTMTMQPIAVHVQREPGRFSTQDAHLAAEKISVVERGAAYLLTRIRRLGTAATRWAEAVMADRGVAGVRVLQGLWSLSQRYPSAALARACATAHAHGCYRLRTLRALLERQPPPQGTFDFLQEHPLIRPLAEYEQFIHNAFQKGESR